MPDPYKSRPDGYGYQPRHPRDISDPVPLSDDRPAGRVDTSREAFEDSNTTGRRRRQQAEVYDAVAARGGRGLTLDELCVLLDLQTQSVSPRLNELSRAGLIRRSGEKRPTRTGKSAYVWIVTANASWAGAPQPLAVGQ